eukprot:2024873-Amphidinium_carterae.1
MTKASRNKNPAKGQGKKGEVTGGAKGTKKRQGEPTFRAEQEQVGQGTAFLEPTGSKPATQPQQPASPA